ncbi:hypothetical protein [Arthrobacter sp. B10-11]|uniref:hypothetical protein n=1 Tax=Arthrobacter sp. B10-11 TaxID=3081160 RepID=UPI0029559761|nr:hypothetical protein [Arthrobacter sp. B10-11]MDV8147520.1 hypothetical protein [Arthrobacter sp. B10-11]
MKDLPTSRPAFPRDRRRLISWLNDAAEKVRTAAVPFRIGDVVLGDDPFNGRRLGVVTVIRGTSLGLRTAADAHPDLEPAVVYYDYRQVRTPD